MLCLLFGFCWFGLIWFFIWIAELIRLSFSLDCLCTVFMIYTSGYIIEYQQCITDCNNEFQFVY